MNPWFGGKRPNTLSVSAFFSKQTDVSDNYYNSAAYNSYYNSFSMATATMAITTMRTITTQTSS